MTVAAAPGVDRSEVLITGSQGSGFNSKLVRFSNVTVTAGVSSGGPLVDYGWLDNCYLRGSSRDTGYAGFDSSWSYKFVTDCPVTDVSVALPGMNLVRGTRVERTGGDVFSDSLLVINSSVHDLVPPPGAHTDVYQATQMADNVILYGVEATDRIGAISSDLTFEVGARDMAVVGCKFSTTGYTLKLVRLTHTNYRRLKLLFRARIPV